MFKIGREEPVASMDSSGKIIWARHNEIQTVNVKARAIALPSSLPHAVARSRVLLFNTVDLLWTNCRPVVSLR